MVPTELGQRTTARIAAFGEGNDNLLIATMAAKVPQNGITAAKMPGERALPQPAHRMLDSRILASALQFLDEDLAEPFLAGLGKYRALVKAARDSLTDPHHAEVMVTLIDPYEITSTQHPYVTLAVDDREVARVTFEISTVFDLGQTTVAVRRGAIESVECDVCSLAITLSLEGCKEPLLHRKVQLPVRLSVQPPITIPLSGSA